MSTALVLPARAWIRRFGKIGLLLAGLLIVPTLAVADEAPPKTAEQTVSGDGEHDADTEHPAESKFQSVDSEQDNEHDQKDDKEDKHKIEVDEWAASVIISVLGVLLLAFSLVQIRQRKKRNHEKLMACVKGYGWDCLRHRGFIWWIPAILVAFSFYSLAIEAITEREFHGMVFAFLPGTSVLLARYIGALLTKQEEERLRDEAAESEHAEQPEPGASS